MDHFGKGKELDEAIMGLRVVFLTHIHGDHQLGVVKLMTERDNLVDPKHHPNSKLYVVTPSPMLSWVEQFRSKLKSPENTVIIPSYLLNPEPKKYYEEEVVERRKVECPSRSKEEVTKMID